MLFYAAGNTIPVSLNLRTRANIFSIIIAKEGIKSCFNYEKNVLALGNARIMPIFAAKFRVIMRKYISTIIVAAVTLVPLTAATRAKQQVSTLQTQCDSIVARYARSLDALSTANKPDSVQAVKMPSPYMFRIFGPGTLYASALSQTFGTQTNLVASTSNSRPDPQLALNTAVSQQLAKAYVTTPQLFTTTEEQLQEAGTLRTDLATEVVEPQEKLADKVEAEAIQIDIEPVEPEVTKPNFWAFKGNGGLQFTQSYFSKNWYQGGENNYAMLGLLNFDANYNNQRRVQLDNKLEAQLGFQTSESSSPKFRPTSNLLRFTSNLGIKAVGNWNYAAQLQLQSQPYRSYKGSTKTVVGDIIAPLYVRSSIGMDFKLKKPRFEGTLKLAPLSYVITYVRVDSLIGNYGIHEGHHSKHEWGPNIEARFKWNMFKNVSWESRIYAFTTFSLFRFENENTFNFTINKYLSAKFFLYPRFEDIKYYNYKENDDGSRADDSARKTHWMFKEFFSLGLNYDF